LFLDKSITENFLAPNLRQVAPGGWLRWDILNRLASNYSAQLDVRTPSLRQKLRNLSGGNQQKVFLGEWLATGPSILIVDEPTRGIDVGTKQEIHRLLRRLAAEGKAVMLISSDLPEALRVLTSPAETGAVTLALPEDVQTEAYDYPDSFFRERVWHVPRPRPDTAALQRAAQAIRQSRRPLPVAGGGLIYSGATEVLRRLVESTGIPVGETMAGKGSLRFDHPQSCGAIGVTGGLPANRLAREADLVLGVGTRYGDFTLIAYKSLVDVEAGVPDGEVPLLRDACVTVVGTHGKRLRPLLLLLACAAFDEVTPLAITNGCLVELVHTASLVHDDVVDEANARRGAAARAMPA
jgi:hypothetical protein